MQRLLILFLILIPALVLKSQEKIDDKYIVWSSDYKLKWSDFLGVPDTKQKFTAVSWTLIKRERSDLFDDKIQLDVSTVFSKDKSWVKKERANQNLLSHEQLHLDITELFARKIRKVYSNHISENLSDSYKYFNEEFDKISMEKKKFQDLYDKETELSMNEEKQKEWEEKVKKLLEDYSDYSDRQVVVKRVNEN